MKLKFLNFFHLKSSSSIILKQRIKCNQNKEQMLKNIDRKFQQPWQVLPTSQFECIKDQIKKNSKWFIERKEFQKSTRWKHFKILSSIFVKISRKTSNLNCKQFLLIIWLNEFIGLWNKWKYRIILKWKKILSKLRKFQIQKFNNIWMEAKTKQCISLFIWLAKKTIRQYHRLLNKKIHISFPMEVVGMEITTSYKFKWPPDVFKNNGKHSNEYSVKECNRETSLSPCLLLTLRSSLKLLIAITVNTSPSNRWNFNAKFKKKIILNL